MRSRIDTPIRNPKQSPNDWNWGVPVSARETRFLIALTAIISMMSACTDKRLTDAAENQGADPYRDELEQMAGDMINKRMVTGFSQDVTLPQAYELQDEFVEITSRSLGEVIGYKTGGHHVGSAFPFFPPEGIRGSMQSGKFLPSGSTVDANSTINGFLEADVAFRVGSAAINNAQSDLEILASLDAFIPFAEVPDAYFVEATRSPTAYVVANLGNGYMFTGEPVPLEATEEWLEKLNSFTFAAMNENGDIIEEGQIAGWYKPLTVIRWLRDQLLQTGHTLEPGQLLSLGNIGITRQLHDRPNNPPGYRMNQFRLEYYGLVDGETPFVTINLERH